MNKQVIYCGYVAVGFVFLYLLGRLGTYTLLSQLPWLNFNIAALVYLVKKHRALKK